MKWRVTLNGNYDGKQIMRQPDITEMKARIVQRQSENSSKYDNDYGNGFAS